MSNDQSNTLELYKVEIIICVCNGDPLREREKERERERKIERERDRERERERFLHTFDAFTAIYVSLNCSYYQMHHPCFRLSS